MYVFRLIFYSIGLATAWSSLQLGYLETAKNPYFEENQYPYENHTLITEDGYKLLLVRLFSKGNEEHSNKTKPPILFVHGNSDMFFSYLVSGPGIALGFKVLEAGYDVFFLNTRGNRFSNTHLTLDAHKDAKKYWNFSWHELGIYDLPITIDYVTNLTGVSNISYVGHSQGGTSFLVMTSTKPEYNKKIRLAVLMAPVAYADHASFVFISVGKYIMPLIKAVSNIFNIHGTFYSSYLARILRVACSPNSVLQPACKVLYWGIAGISTQYNKTIISAIFTNIPAGSSVKQWLHYEQSGKSGKFQFYNYGKKGNLAQYGQSAPPDYNLSEVTCSVGLYYGDSDSVASLIDVQRLAKELPNLVEDVMVPYNKTNHFDLLGGRFAGSLVNEPILKLFNKYNNL